MLQLTCHKLCITPHVLSDHCSPTSNRSFVLMREVKLTDEGNIVYKNEIDNILPTRTRVNATYRSVFCQFMNKIIDQTVEQCNDSLRLSVNCSLSFARFAVHIVFPLLETRFITHEDIRAHFLTMGELLYDNIIAEPLEGLRNQTLAKFNDLIAYQDHDD